MYKQLILIFIIFISCEDTKYKENLFFYTDSTFEYKKDSIYVDSLSQVNIDGFLRFYHADNQSFEQGEINKGNRLGKWQSYTALFNDENVLDEVKIYSQGGDLINYKAFDHTTKQIIEDKNYIYDNLVGIQKEFYPSGKLHIQYETDKEGRYINDFIVLSEIGKEIFTSHLGEKGSGDIKYYDKDNNIIWEGLFKNKKKEGWHHEYVIGYGGEKIETISTLFQNNQPIKTKIIN
jgi:antitoxin component YwqK of YwqJK toxin-antitoxin module